MSSFFGEDPSGVGGGGGASMSFLDPDEEDNVVNADTQGEEFRFDFTVPSQQTQNDHRPGGHHQSAGQLYSKMVSFNSLSFVTSLHYVLSLCMRVYRLSPFSTYIGLNCMLPCFVHITHQSFLNHKCVVMIELCPTYAVDATLATTRS